MTTTERRQSVSWASAASVVDFPEPGAQQKMTGACGISVRGVGGPGGVRLERAPGVRLKKGRVAASPADVRKRWTRALASTPTATESSTETPPASALLIDSDFSAVNP